MSGRSPYVFELSAEERTMFEELSRARSASYMTVVRAKIVLMSADNYSNIVIAARLGVHVNMVRRWRKRFFESGIHGLVDRPRREQSRSSAIAAKVESTQRQPPVKQVRLVPLSPMVANARAVDEPLKTSATGPNAIRGANQTHGGSVQSSRCSNSPMPAAVGQLIPFRSRPKDTIHDTLRYLVTLINHYLDETDAELTYAGRAGGPWRFDLVDDDSDDRRYTARAQSLIPTPASYLHAKAARARSSRLPRLVESGTGAVTRSRSVSVRAVLPHTAYRRPSTA